MPRGGVADWFRTQPLRLGVPMDVTRAEGVEDWYAELVRRMHTPSFVVDNDACINATVIKVIRVEGINSQGILLEVVQVLADLNLVVTKANMSFDGEWFMDVFHVTDADGRKLRDEQAVDRIQETLAARVSSLPAVMSSLGMATPKKKLTSIEMTGADRPGLLSEVCAVLRDMKCNVVEAEVWTHNRTVAAVVHVTDGSTGAAVEDPGKMSAVRELLCNVLKGDGEAAAGKTRVSVGATHTQRRLHQMMSAERDYELADRRPPGVEDRRRTQVTLSLCSDKGYSMVTLRSKDRPKLLFDILCALTDMQYVVFHGAVMTTAAEARQEYYIRHTDGSPVCSEAESLRVAKCLETAAERRSCEGLELGLQTEDCVGLLSDVTRIFRENGLCIRRAEISTKGGKAVDTFYVSDAAGGRVEAKTVDSISRQLAQMGHAALRVKGSQPQLSLEPPPEEATGFLLGSFLKVCSLHSFKQVG